MQGAVLVYGGNTVDRDRKTATILSSIKLALDNTDVMVINVPESKKSIGIDQIREAISFLNKKPCSEAYKAVVIPKAEKLTIEAQNSLLKLLEEPPLYATIILSSKTQDSLLPTVVSRCQKIAVEQNYIYKGETSSQFADLQKMDYGQRLSWAEEASKQERDGIIEILELWVLEERKDLYKSADKSANIKNILKIKLDLENTNVNQRLALEYLVLSII